DGELKVCVTGGKRLEIVDAIARRAAIKLGAVVLQFLGDFRVARRALEDHVLEQMRHAGFAVTFLPRTDQHGKIYRDLGLRVVRKEQDAEAIIELVFADAFDSGDQFWRCVGGVGASASCQGCGASQCCDGMREGENKFESFHINLLAVSEWTFGHLDSKPTVSKRRDFRSKSRSSRSLS